MSAHPVAEKLFIDGPAGRLEAVVERPGEGALEGCAVVCHPHPQHGGTMHNKVAHTLARALRQAYIVDVDLEARSTSAQMKTADRRGARLVVVLGEDEWQEGNVVLRDMKSGEQETVDIESLPARMDELLGFPAEVSGP